ncbi:BTB/POZ domain-containing protein KCTD6-like [Acanthaster planci]|uniref:BTB/POZ domain-containing protein KCTD6-like n=1 Tax=Acanthaster planci TaxID=133434 RepID=A0A8B8A1P9_ACAPL|nr:BTB/POZ domain-containing protein KCTD6-like [Acanthaster planci]
MEDLVTLNVGGCLHTTTITTLTRFPDSMLGSMFSGRLPTSRDSHGHYIIDGDGPTFRHVLNFLRRSALCLPADFSEWDLLAAEADFYQITELIDAVRSLREERLAKLTPPLPKTPEMEFIEIVTDSVSREFTYFGGFNTLKQIPLLLGFFQAHSNQDRSVLRRVERDGAVTAAHGVVAPNRMKIFQEISKLGFQLLNKSTFGAENGSERWLFGRTPPSLSMEPESSNCRI